MPKKAQKTKDVSAVAELKNQLARALADYDNLRKRTESEKVLWLKFAKQEVLIRFLPVLDTLEAAQSHLKDEGLKLAIREFKDVLKEEGIEEIETKEFDAEIHEGLDSVPGGKEGEIAEVLQKGYKFSDGSIIRPAKVRVHEGS